MRFSQDQVFKYFRKKLRFRYILGSQKTTKHGTIACVIFFPPPFFHLIFWESVWIGLHITDNCCAFLLYIHLFPSFFDVTKTWLSVATAVHWQVYLDFDQIPAGQASSSIATLAVNRSQEATAAETESSSRIHIRTGAHILGRSNMWMLTVNWGKPRVYYCQMYPWAWIHLQIN